MTKNDLVNGLLPIVIIAILYVVLYLIAEGII